jgi:hypothetical protein
MSIVFIDTILDQFAFKPLGPARCFPRRAWMVKEGLSRRGGPHLPAGGFSASPLGQLHQFSQRNIDRCFDRRHGHRSPMRQRNYYVASVYARNVQNDSI